MKGPLETIISLIMFDQWISLNYNIQKQLHNSIDRKDNKRNELIRTHHPEY